MVLDIESVRLFVLTAEYGNLTRAAEAAGTAQPAVSARLKSLEALLGHKLLERTPRYVRLTDEGSQFLERARKLLLAHDLALAPYDAVQPRITLGVSDHALGTGFDALLRRLRAALPNAAFTVRLGQSAQIRDSYETGEIELAVIRREGAGPDGEVLGEDPLIWRTSAQRESRRGALPLVSLPPPCGVRAVATRALDRAGLAWHEAFVGGSCLALVAALRAGLGVAPLGRMVGGGLEGLCDADDDDLPLLPSSQIVMLARASGQTAASAARVLAASVRESLKHPG